MAIESLIGAGGGRVVLSTSFGRPGLTHDERLERELSYARFGSCKSFMLLEYDKSAGYKASLLPNVYLRCWNQQSPLLKLCDTY